MCSLRQALDKAQQHYSLEALDAELLLAKVLDKPRSYILSWPQATLDAQQWSRFQELARRRGEGEPLAYIVGQKEFWSLTLKVNRHTLIPRPETEVLVERVLERIPAQASWHILDIGTGCGAIALALAKERPRCRVVACDLDPEALETGRLNAQLLEIPNIEFVKSDLFFNIDEIFNIIVSNPPYVEKGDPHLHALRYEPQRALVAEEKGLGIIKAICRQAKDHLAPNGFLALEHGYDQSDALQKLLMQNGYQNITPFQDYSGQWRGVLGQQNN